jgi:hypothetical protein
MKALRIAVLLFLFGLSGSIVFGQTQTPRVDKREANQQERIKEGVKSGELTGKETMKLEKQQRKIRRDEMKAKSDGVVTPGERAKLHREQKRASKNIYKKKHNKADKE